MVSDGASGLCKVSPGKLSAQSHTIRERMAIIYSAALTLSLHRCWQSARLLRHLTAAVHSIRRHPTLHPASISMSTATLPTPTLPAAQFRDHVPSASTECFDVLTADGQPTGRTKLRSAVHRDGDWHRAVHVWVVHTARRQLLIQLRAACKDSWPSHWDVGCAGHLSAGEDSLTAARAELTEELGITADGDDSSGRPPHNQLQHIATLQREVISQHGRFIDREWTDVYMLAGQYEVESMKLQDDEVEAVRYVDVDEYVSMLEADTPGYVCYPDLPEYQRRVFDVIQRTLQEAGDGHVVT